MDIKQEDKSAEGWILLKRKKFWVKRFAFTANGVFHYASGPKSPQSKWK